MIVGVTNIDNNNKTQVKQYLLGQLGGADEERLELRLLTDPSFGEEFDTIVDEITDQYVSGEFQGEELKRVEQHFLRAPERQTKAQFAAALIDQATAREPEPVKLTSDVGTPTLRGRWRALWSPENFAWRFAATAAIVVIAAGLAFMVFRDQPTYRNFASLELTISTSDRAEGSEYKPLHLAPENDAAKIILQLPEQTSQYTSFQVELVDRDGVRRPVEIKERNQRTATVIIPATALLRGSYALHLSGIKPDGKQERIAGSYFFRVE